MNMKSNLYSQPIAGYPAFIRPPEHYRYLPNPAKCALEYLDAQNRSDRTIKLLDKYIDHYFTVTGQSCEDHTRYSCHYIAIKRFLLEGDAVIGSLYSTTPVAAATGALEGEVLLPESKLLQDARSLVEDNRAQDSMAR